MVRGKESYMEFDEDSIRLRVPVSQGTTLLAAIGPFSGFEVIFFFLEHET